MKSISEIPDCPICGNTAGCIPCYIQDPNTNNVVYYGWKCQCESVWFDFMDIWYVPHCQRKGFQVTNEPTESTRPEIDFDHLTERWTDKPPTQMKVAVKTKRPPWYVRLKRWYLRYMDI